MTRLTAPQITALASLIGDVKFTQGRDGSVYLGQGDVLRVIGPDGNVRQYEITQRAV